VSRTRRADALRAELPIVLDVVQVAMGAGASPYRSIEIAARWAPPGARRELAAVLHAVRLGDSLAAALGRLGRQIPPFAPLTDVLVATEQLGAPAGPALGRVADEVRAELRRRGEARARVLPVKLLFPLVFLVLPAFGLLTVVPALLSALARV
jgi:tight adherence protein C